MSLTEKFPPAGSRQTMTLVVGCTKQTGDWCELLEKKCEYKNREKKCPNVYPIKRRLTYIVSYGEDKKEL